MNFTRVITAVFKKKLFQAILKSEEFQFYDFKRIKDEQELNFLSLINHANINVPFYKDRLGFVNSISDLIRIPFLSKEDIRSNTNDLKASNIDLGRFQKDGTSGSTGESLYFFTDSQNYVKKAVHIRGDGWAGLSYGDKALYLWGAERDISKNKSFYFKLKDQFFTKRKIISTFHMSDSDIGKYVEVINKYKPSVIISYPSPLYRVANYIKEHNLEVFSPKGIITSAETLFEFQRASIEDVFNSKVFNRFGCREVGHIASECEFHEGLHINSDNLIVEIIDENGEPCKKGELGEIVITDLFNYVFPLIRYKTGDLGVMAEEKCSCGRKLPLLKKVEGRIFDLIIGLNGNVVGGTYWTLLKYKLKGWQKFQILQENKSSLDIIVENNVEIEDDFNEKITEIVQEQLGKEMEVNVKIVDKIPETKTGKHRWIVSKISPYVK